MQEEGTPRMAAKDRPEFTWGKIKTTEGIRSTGIKVRVNVPDLVSSSYINQIIIELFGGPSGLDFWTG